MKIPPMFFIKVFLLFRSTIYAQAVLWYDLDICTHSDTVKITFDIPIFDHGCDHFFYETCLSCATLLDTVRLRQQGMGDGYV